MALTSTCCKILESIIASELTDFLLKHNLIFGHQHDFLKKHSTCTNLLETINDWTIHLSNRKSVVAAYIDFARAFDSISHCKLLCKLISHGISGNLLFWIEAFITNCSQCVRVGSTLSSFCPVSSGIVQGSVLGPALFNLFINDITDNLGDNINVKLFADDVKLYSEMSTHASASTFQEHLNHIHKWSIDWQLAISLSKCNLFELGPHCLSHPFFLSTTQLPYSDTVKDLGINIGPNLKFCQHITELTAKANQRSHLIHRCFLSRNIKNLIKAFIVYVGPLLEYVSPV